MAASGRVRLRVDRRPNLTDVERVCKEANFSQNWFQFATAILVSMQALDRDRGKEQYAAQPVIGEFDRHNHEALRTLSQHQGEFLGPSGTRRASLTAGKYSERG